MDRTGSPASFVTARSIPPRTPPPRPVRSPRRDASPSPAGTPATRSLAPSSAPTSQSDREVTLIHGTEFEIVAPVPRPSASPPKPSTYTTSPSRPSPMSSFVFPPPVSRANPPSPLSRRQGHQPSGSIFRLDRPHALPESYLAVRESLTQDQIEAFTASLASQFSGAWSETDSSSVMSSPTKERSKGNAGGESTADPEDWARQRRMSSLLSGLGMVLGSTSFSAGALMMQEEDDEGDEERPQREVIEQLEAIDVLSLPSFPPLSPPTSPPRSTMRPSQTQTESGDESSESAGEGEDGSGMSRPRPSSRADVRGSRRNSTTSELLPATLPPLPTFDPIPSPPSTLPLSPSTQSIKSQDSAAEFAVSFGYACGGIEDENDAGVEGDIANEADDEAAPASSVKQLVRQSWRLSSSSAGARDFKPLSEKRVSMQALERHEDGLGLNLELLDFSTVRGGMQSSYTPSSRPVMPHAASINAFPEVPTAPASSSVRLDLPSSPPLIAEPPTPAPSMTTPALSATPSLSPSLSLLSTPEPGQDPTPTSPSIRLPATTSSSSRNIPAPQPRSSSLTSVSPGLSHSRRTSTEDGPSLSRRRSVLSSSLASHKSSKRLSALITSGMEKVRSRTSSHNSNNGDDEKDDLRTSRRRAITDGLISGPVSAPLPSVPFPPPPLLHASPASSSSPLLPYPSSSGALPSPRSDLAPPTPSTPLTQSPHMGRTWRSTLDDARYQNFVHSYGAMEMRRQEVIWELCETERSFVNGLRGVIEVFTLPLRTRSGTWIKGVPVSVSRLLDWLDDIVYLHSQVSAALEDARTAQQPVVLKIADAFLSFVSRLEVHQPYLVRFETVTRSIDEMTADPASDFGEFVRMQSSLPECGSLSLSSFLLKPVQRLMKYPLFFKQLCDLTPPTHPDHFSTLSLLHSTDSIIRVMQEVKTREDEYEEAKVLQSRIYGLPEGFQLACRDRRLVAHGVLRRVHVNDKDRSVLEMDAMARAGRRGAAMRSGGLPTPPGLSPPVEMARPQSTASDSGSSSLSAGSLTYSSDLSSGWNSPTTPGAPNGAFHSPTNLEFSSSPGYPPLLRPDSMVSNASSVYSEDSFKAVPSAFSASAPSRRASRRIVKTKAKESSVYVFVFSDLIVLATKAADASRFMRSSKSGSRRSEQGSLYRALETVGLSRVLGVSDLSGKTEHDHLIEVDLLPIREGQDQSTPLSLTNTSLATSIYLTLPPLSSSRSPLHSSTSLGDSQFKERIRWLQAFERSYLFALRSLSFPSLLNAFTTPITASERLSCASYLDMGIIPKSPSQQHLEKLALGGADGTTTEDGAEQEREERGWWAVRLKKVRKEMEGSLVEARAPGVLGGGAGGGGGGGGGSTWTTGKLAGPSRSKRQAGGGGSSQRREGPAAGLGIGSARG
ncbi:hypothetical protein JCM1840_004030 [Sporobolomyces johnsonii]